MSVARPFNEEEVISLPRGAGSPGPRCEIRGEKKCNTGERTGGGMSDCPRCTYSSSEHKRLWTMAGICYAACTREQHSNDAVLTLRHRLSDGGREEGLSALLLD